MFKFPYRWMWRTTPANLLSLWWGIIFGVKNLWRWLPIIWSDYDWDWSCTAKILEIKLRRLADCMENGSHVHGGRDAKQARTCAALLKRLQEDKYFENAGYRAEAWGTMSDFEGRRIARHSTQMAKQDQQYLGLLLGKYIRNWWD